MTISIPPREMSVGLTLQTEVRSESVVVVMAGMSDEPDASSVTEYLIRAHALALMQNATEFVVDVRFLTFVNSCFLKAIISWLGRIPVGPAKPCRVRFRADSTIDWQRRSLDAIRRLAPALVSVDFTTAEGEP
jgi:hypothetical protein